MTDWWAHIKHFTQEEMACKCGCGKSEMTKHTMLRLDMLRSRLGHPIAVTSAYRCAEWNKAVGGSKNSAHLDGTAVDIALTHAHRFNALGLIENIGFTGVGFAKTFTHLDDSANDARSRPMTWCY